MTSPGIRWHLINNWEGHGFRSHTFAARVPGGALIKTTERFLAAIDLRQEVGAGADDLEHITSALVFVPGINVTTDDTTGDYATLSRWRLKHEPAEPYRIELDETERLVSVEIKPAAKASSTAPTGSHSISFQAKRTDPELDGADFEPEPSNRWAGVGALFRKLWI